MIQHQPINCHELTCDESRQHRTTVCICGTSSLQTAGGLVASVMHSDAANHGPRPEIKTEISQNKSADALEVLCRELFVLNN